MWCSQGDPIAKDIFMTRWKAAVGDTFEASVDLGLLSVRYSFDYTLLAPIHDIRRVITWSRQWITRTV